MNTGARGLPPLIFALTSSFAAAQEEPPGESLRALEEIVVLAQKREQTLEEVPIAVSAYDGAQLELAGVFDIRDLVGLSPSLMLTSSQSEAAGSVARIRGVGTTGDNPGLESSVAVFIDGVYRSRNSLALTDLGKVERIEVLRGPQGTLFGKNASAGMIHIITAQPEYTHASYVDVTGGNYSHLRASAGATGPLIDNRAAWRLDGVWTQRDGFVEDLITGQDYNDRDRLLLRGQLSLDPSDAVSARLIGDVSRRRESCCAAVTRIEGPTGQIIQALGGNLVSPPDPFARLASANEQRGFRQNVDEWGLSAEVGWALNGVDLTSITAWRDWDNERSQDADFTDVDLLYRAPGRFTQRFQTLSQELRAGGLLGRLDWLAGFYFVYEDLDLRDAVQTGVAYEPYLDILLSQATGIPNALPFLTGLEPGTHYLDGYGSTGDEFDQRADSWALFTHNTFQLTDRLSTSLGLRYTEERKRLDVVATSLNPGCPAAAQRLAAGEIPAALGEAVALICLPFFNPLNDGVYSGRRRDSEWSGTVNLAYELTDDINTYVSAGRGYKAGGFNLDRAGLGNPLVGVQPSIEDLAFGAETVDAYEAGVKSRWLDDTLSVNVALFYSEFEDFQLNTFTGLNFVVDNLSRARTQGVELELMHRLQPLTLTGGVTYSDARYGRNVEDAFLAGRRLTHAPRWSGTLGATLVHALAPGLEGLVHVDMRYTGGHNTGSDLLPQKHQGGYAVWNLRGGVGPAGGPWRIEAWAQNLFDRDYHQVVFNAPLQGSPEAGTQTFNTFLAEPRTWGATLRWAF